MPASNPGAPLYAKWSTELIEAFGASVMLQPTLHESIVNIPLLIVSLTFYAACH